MSFLVRQDTKLLGTVTVLAAYESAVRFVVLGFLFFPKQQTTISVLFILVILFTTARVSSLDNRSGCVSHTLTTEPKSASLIEPCVVIGIFVS